MKNYKCSECKYGSYYNHFANLWACDLIKDKICTIEYLQAYCPLKDNPTLDDEYEKLNDEYEKGVDKMNDNEMIKAHILCFSGGKDSLAMLITILEKNLPLDEILYVDVGDWMWENHQDHIKNIENKLNVQITQINIHEDLIKGFERWGFPSFFNRWCTGIKKEVMNKYLREKYPDDEIIQYIGYCADEEKRINRKLYSYGKTEYPLVDNGITTEDALRICKEYGFDFGGVYEHHSHFNCWLCPLQRVKELEYIYIYRKDLWDKLREMQSKTDGYYQNGKSIYEFENKFWIRQHPQLKENRMKAREKYNKRKQKR